MVLYDQQSGQEIWSASQFIEQQATNNEAEYLGLLTGLQSALALGIKRIQVEGDSELVIKQVNGVYKVKAENLKGLYAEVINVIRKFDWYQISHIPRKENSRADELANEAMDSRSTKGFTYDESDDYSEDRNDSTYSNQTNRVCYIYYI